MIDKTQTILWTQLNKFSTSNPSRILKKFDIKNRFSTFHIFDFLKIETFNCVADKSIWPLQMIWIRIIIIFKLIAMEFRKREKIKKKRFEF